MFSRYLPHGTLLFSLNSLSKDVRFLKHQGSRYFASHHPDSQIHGDIEIHIISEPYVDVDKLRYDEWSIRQKIREEEGSRGIEKINSCLLNLND